LLILGVNFSKLNLFGPIFLYEVLLILPLFLLIWRIKINLSKDYSIIITALISIIYLIYSLIKIQITIDILIRQFMLFGYLIAAFIYVNYIRRIKNFQVRIIQFFKEFGVVSVIIQIIYLGYVLIFLTSDIFSEGSYYYYSHITVLGLLMFGVQKLVSSKYRLWWSFFTLFLLSTTGHSSAFLAFFIVIFLYFIGKMSKMYKVLILVSFFLIGIIIVLNTSFFSDANAQWRLIYWALTLKEIFVQNFGILGNGFGVPYSDEEVAYILQVVNGFTAQQSDDLEKYLSPMHNSFITIAFHIGFVFSLLVVIPILRVVKNFTLELVSKKSNLFLIHSLSLIAVSIWSATNVILELPHSSILFWLIYLSFINIYPDFIKLTKNERNIRKVNSYAIN